MTRSLLGIAFVVVAAPWAITVYGAEQPAKTVVKVSPKPVEMTPEGIEARLKSVQESKDIDDETRKRFVERYTKTLEQFKLAKEWKEKIDAFDKAIQEAPADLNKAKADLAELRAEQPVGIGSDQTLAELEGELSKAEAKLLEAQKHAAELEAEPRRRSERRKKIPDQISAAEQNIRTRNKQLSTPHQESADLLAARYALAQARKDVAEKEVLACQKENQFYEATGDLLTAERDRSATSLSRARHRIAELKQAVNARRRQEVEAQKLAAREAAVQNHPLAQQMAVENAQLADRRSLMAGQIEDAAQKTDATRKLFDKQLDDFKGLWGKVKLAGMTNAVGALLRKQRAALPDLTRYRQSAADRQQQISTIQLELIELEDARSALSDLDSSVSEALLQLGPSVTEGERAEIETKVSELLETRRNYLDSLINDYDNLFNKMIDLDKSERDLITMTEKHADYIDQRVLWIRSSAELGPTDLSKAWEGVRWLTNPAEWAGACRALAQGTLAHPWGTAAVAVVFVVLYVVRHRLRTRLCEIGHAASKSYADTFLPTLRALVLTILIAMLWPMVLLALAWHLATLENTSEFTKAVASALRATAWVYLAMEIFRQISRPGGLAEAHFSWPAHNVRAIRRGLRWFATVALPLFFVVFVIEGQNSEIRKESLGRLAFMALLLVLAGFAAKLLHPRHGVFAEYLKQNQGAWLDRLRMIWYPLAFGTPLGLALITGMGYYYTAVQLASRMKTTVCFGMVLIVGNAILLRWLLIARRKLAMKRARQRRAAAQEAAQTPSSEIAPILDEPGVALSAIDLQTRGMLRTVMLCTLLLGAWLTWVDVLPALGMLEKIELGWDKVARVTENVTGPDGVITQAETTDGAVPATLADLMLAILIFLVTIVASKNLPGLLEITILQRLPLDPGGRYAFTTVSRYLITTVGMAISASALGIGWANVQWLAAAMTVGLGFGLQEIFANFVSGLILLFERPIRVGDTVTVADVTGTISRIRIRATTITDWDRKELIVPNKAFITDRLVNWTLSDRVTRLVIDVGIAYGSDTELARELLLKVASEHAEVLKDPAPVAAFDSFGASALNFTLRVHLPVDVLLKARHELNTAIDRAFRNAGIEIAFPQQDLHIRSVVQTLPLPMDRQPMTRRESA